jgi:hypothetical protein
MRPASDVLRWTRGEHMSFELVVEIKSGVRNLRQLWQDEINSHGFAVEILPSFDQATWQGGFLPIKLSLIPDKYLFGLPKVIQISGFEIDFGPESAHFRTAMGRTLVELTLQCYGAACLAVITKGIYHDPQSGESFEGPSAIRRADWEIMAYLPYIDQHARAQHVFTKWSDYA